MSGIMPTHRLKALNKVTDERAELGAGWQNEDGSITIQLNPFISLIRDKDVHIRLFPVREDNSEQTT